EEQFAAGADNDPYGFKPTDLVVDRDGSLFIADWADGQRPKRGRGRVYRVSHAGARAAPARPLPRGASVDLLITRLDSDSYHERVQAQEAIQSRGPAAVEALLGAVARGRVGVRGRLHAVWAVARAGGAGAAGRLLDLALGDADPRVQAQAVRALADLTDPSLVGGAGDEKLARRLAAWAE